MAKKKQNYYQGERHSYSADDGRRYFESKDSASSKINKIGLLPLAEKKAAIRELLIEIGTDVDKYDSDPTGDGDQSIISSVEKRDVARHIWCAGGDIGEHFSSRQVSKFAIASASGNLKMAQSELQRVKSTVSQQPYFSSNEVTKLLETRETSMRLSPLLLIVSMGKNLFSPTGQQQFESVAK